MTIGLSNQVTNIYVRRYLESSTTSYQKNMEQLSSGSKLTSMGEDPIGVSTAVKLSIQTNFNQRIQSNIALGNDMLSMTEGYQENILTNIQRMQSLALQACNQSYSQEDRDAIYNEIQERLSYINSTADSVNYNGSNLLDGSSLNLNLKIGQNVSDLANIGSVLIDSHADALDMDLSSPVSEQDWSDYLGRLDNASNILTTNIAKIGAFQNRLTLVSDNLTSTNQDLTEYKSAISDVDVAQASADMVRNQILQQTATAIFVQTNKTNQLAYSLFQI